MMAVRKPLRTFRHHARASRPDMMRTAGVAELVDALDLGSSDESRGGSSPSARTKRFRRLHDDYRRPISKGQICLTNGSAEPATQAFKGRVGQIDNVLAFSPDQAGRRLTHAGHRNPR